MEFYQYLLRNNGFNVSDTRVLCLLQWYKKKERFDEKLDFEIYLLDYTGNDEWIEKTLKKLVNTLKDDKIPEHNDDCDYCKYQTKLSVVANL